jgi:hypothetical protein
VTRNFGLAPRHPDQLSTAQEEMNVAKKKQLPEQIYIYAADVVDGVTFYGAAQILEEIPDDTNVVGVYERVREARLVITRDLE